MPTRNRKRAGVRRDRQGSKRTHWRRKDRRQERKASGKTGAPDKKKRRCSRSRTCKMSGGKSTAFFDLEMGLARSRTVPKDCAAERSLDSQQSDPW